MPASPTPASNAQWDVSPLLPNAVRIMSADAGDTPTGTTPTTESDDTVYGTSTKVQRWNGALTQTWAKTLGAPIDMTQKSLALLVKATSPEQQSYNTGVLAANFTLGTDTTISFNAGHTFGAGPQVFDLGGGVVVSGTLATNSASGVVRISGTNGAVVNSGSTVVQSNASVSAAFDFIIQMAVDAGSIANRYEVRPVAGGYGGWTWIMGTAGLAQATLGPEFRIQGAGCDLTNIGYIKITASQSATLPTTPGPQVATIQSEIKWDSLFTFDRTTRRRVSFTFDDGTTTHYSIVADEAQKPRPGFPNGMRATFVPIMENVELGVSDSSLLSPRQMQTMSESGHEIGLHADRIAHHQAEQDAVTGRGPLVHLEANTPGAALASLTAQIANLAKYGVKQPLSFAWPQSDMCGAAFPGFLSNGIYGARTLSEGGGTPVVTNGATTSADITGFSEPKLNRRFIGWPATDIHKLPASPTRANLATVSSSATLTSGTNQATGTTGITTAHIGAAIINTAKIPDGTTITAVSGGTVTMSANALSSGTVTVTVGDQRGERAGMRAILQACQQGMSLCFYSHQMGEVGSSVTANKWTRTQFANVLNYISDLKQGTNVYGNNAALDHYADLDVVPFVELLSGRKVAPAVVETVGLGC